MLKSFNVAPLGQNYTEFLESSSEKSLATFLQERLEKYKTCILQLSQQQEAMELLPGDSSSQARGGIDALVDGLIATYDDTRAVMTNENWGALPAFWERCKRPSPLDQQVPHNTGIHIVWSLRWRQSYY